MSSITNSEYTPQYYQPEPEEVQDPYAKSFFLIALPVTIGEVFDGCVAIYETVTGQHSSLEVAHTVAETLVSLAELVCSATYLLFPVISPYICPKKENNELPPQIPYALLEPERHRGPDAFTSKFLVIMVATGGIETISEIFHLIYACNSNDTYDIVHAATGIFVGGIQTVAAYSYLYFYSPSRTSTRIPTPIQRGNVVERIDRTKKDVEEV